MEEKTSFPHDPDGTESVLGDDMPRDRTTVSARWALALRRLMEKRGITQLELATRAGVDKDTVSNLLRGESSSTATLEKLAQALGVDISELVLTAEQSRILAEHWLHGDDLARRLSREVAATLLNSTAPSAPQLAAGESGQPSEAVSRDRAAAREQSENHESAVSHRGSESRITPATYDDTRD